MFYQDLYRETCCSTFILSHQSKLSASQTSMGHQHYQTSSFSLLKTGKTPFPIFTIVIEVASSSMLHTVAASFKP